MPLSIRHAALPAVLLAAAALAGCSEGREQPPKTTVTVVNAAPTRGTIDFLREQRVEASLDYRVASSTLVFDEDEYDFNIETTLPGASAQLLDTFSQEVVHGTDYLFVITERGGSVVHLAFEKPTFSSTSEAEAQVVHAAPSGPAMDVYITAPDADLASAAPFGSVAFEEATEPSDLAPGDYVLTLTAAGDPANVLFTSTTISVGAGASLAFVIAQEAGEGLTPYSVVVAATSGPGQLFDKNAPSGIEIVNAAADGAPRDLYLDDDFSTPIVAALPGGSVSAQVTVPAGTRKLGVTPAGNTGVVEVEQSYSAVTARRETALIAGAAGSLTLTLVQDDPRPVVGESRVRFVNAATLFAGISFYIMPSGTDVTTVSPVATLTPAAISARVAIPPGTYDVALLDPTTTTVIAGPQSITFDDASLVTLLAKDGAASGTADLVLLQGFD